MPRFLRRTLLASLIVAGGLLFHASHIPAQVAGGAELWFSEDIGSVAVAGSSSYDDQTDEFTVEGSGDGIGGTADAFHFTYLFLNGDGSITARITGVENTAADALGGIAIRQDSEADSAQITFAAKPDGSLHVISRTAAQGTASSTAVSSGSFPRWVRMTRDEDDFIYATSTDGVVWTDEGTIPIAMDDVVQIGLIATSADDGELCTSLFDAVDVTGNTNDIDLDGLPDDWEREHFGNLESGSVGDPDNDGLTNLQELQFETSPVLSDTDEDGLSDGWETANGTNSSVADAEGDADSDDIKNVTELVAGTAGDVSGLPTSGAVATGLEVYTPVSSNE